FLILQNQKFGGGEDFRNRTVRCELSTNSHEPLQRKCRRSSDTGTAVSKECRAALRRLSVASGRRFKSDRSCGAPYLADRSVYFRIIVIRLSGARLVAVDMKSRTIPLPAKARKMTQPRPTEREIQYDQAAAHRELTGCTWRDVKGRLRQVGLRPTRQRVELASILFAK